MFNRILNASLQSTTMKVLKGIVSKFRLNLKWNLGKIQMCEACSEFNTVKPNNDGDDMLQMYLQLTLKISTLNIK